MQTCRLTLVRGFLRYEGGEQLFGPQLSQGRRHPQLVLKLGRRLLVVFLENQAAEDGGSRIGWILVLELGQLA